MKMKEKVNINLSHLANNKNPLILLRVKEGTANSAVFASEPIYCTIVLLFSTSKLIPCT